MVIRPVPPGRAEHALQPIESGLGHLWSECGLSSCKSNRHSGHLSTRLLQILRTAHQKVVETSQALELVHAI